MLLGLLFLLLLAVPVVTWQWVQRDRAELADKFAQDRLSTLRLVAKEVEEDVQDVVDDLRFVVRIVETGTTEAHLRQLLLALLGTSRAYRGIVLERRSGEPWLRFPDPQRPLPTPERFDGEIRRVMGRMARPDAPAIAVSSPIVVGQSWYRVFATRLSGGNGRVALIVDTYPHLSKLRLVAADPQTRLLVLGPDGHPGPACDGDTSRAVRLSRKVAVPKFRGLLRRMAAGRSGSLGIDAQDARQIGLGRADLVVAYHSIRMQDSGHWSVATMTSTEAIQSHERSLLLRFGLGSGVVMILLLGLGSYVLHTGYRHATMLEQVQHAAVVAHLSEKAQKTLDSIPSGVLVLGEDDRVSDVNRALTEKLPESILGRTLSEALPAASAGAREHMGRLVAEAKRTGVTQSAVMEHLALFGENGHYRLHAVPLRPASAQAAMLLVVDDITELKMLEEQLLRTEKLSTVGTLAAGIAHEVGTPLSVVRGRSEYILSKLEADSPHAPGLRIVVEQSDRIIRIVRELLDFSRASPPQPMGVDVSPLVSKSLELLRYEAHRRGVTLSADLAAALPLVAADPDQLQQVLVNLLMNAIDVSEPGQAVSVQATVERTAGPSPTHVRIEIRDHGPGIDPAILHRVYDPFFTTKKRGQGTGLGLFIAANIVRNHHAELDLQSHPGEGTRAVLRWPVHRGGAHDQEA